MTEAIRRQEPLMISFENEIFPIIEMGEKWSIGELNVGVKELINDAYFQGREVLVTTRKNDLASVELCLRDHGILPTRLEVKPSEKSETKAQEFCFGIIN